MSVLSPLPREAIADPELRDLIAQGEALGVPDALFSGILARAPYFALFRSSISCASRTGAAGATGLSRCVK